MTEREKIAARIRALLAKTVENGCTEDEAVAAAAKASEMLARYNMTVDEAEMRASPFQHHTETHSDPVGERLWKIADAVQDLTGARYWTSRPGVFPIEINFFGFAHEVDVARYLLEICARAMRQEHARADAEFAFFVQSRRRGRVAAFLDGMADRLRTRIRALKPPAPTGTGLVVLHGALIDAAMLDAGHNLEARGMRGSRDLDPEYLHGQMAGDRVSLHRGLRSGERVAGMLR